MDEIVVNLSELTWGELEEIEKLAGVDAARLMLEGKVGPSAMVALIYVMRRRDNPNITLDEIRNLPVSTPVRVEQAEANPTVRVDGNGNSPASPDSATSTASAPLKSKK